MLDMFKSFVEGISNKKKFEKNIMTGDRCRAVLVNGPQKISKFIGEEVNAYYMDNRLYLQNDEMGVLRTSAVNKINRLGELISFRTEDSEYEIRLA
ncbi:hypothetical protein [Lacrimispora amygdalina]|uniref:hypothetical protein n=1 Tax=Lacrimispora amygdalina TaxID=253257 RepID=UPI000BE48A07|nr:hypothetical protein [Lacrimispora amygdalina]